jgi:hypothetical protein
MRAEPDPAPVLCAALQVLRSLIHARAFWRRSNSDQRLAGLDASENSTKLLGCAALGGAGSSGSISVRAYICRQVAQLRACMCLSGSLSARCMCACWCVLASGRVCRSPEPRGGSRN